MIENDGFYLDCAITLAVLAHATQKDLQGNPYILHPLRVMLSAPDELKVAAVLHDVLEDTATTSEVLSKIFSKRDCELVQILTHQKGEPREDYISRILEDDDATKIKILDIMDNKNRLFKITDIETKTRLTIKYERDLAQIEKKITQELVND